MEQWKLVPDTDGKYEVSNHGHVRNASTGAVLKPRRTRTGYQRVHINRKDMYIHRLVADAFCNHPDGCNVVNHLDNDPTNNHADNLEWTTQKGNWYHASRQGRIAVFPNAIPVVGEKDNKMYLFCSAHEAALNTGCDHSMIIKCCKKIKRTTKGFTWRYAGVTV